MNAARSAFVLLRKRDVKALEFAINSEDSFFQYFPRLASAALIYSKMSAIREFHGRFEEIDLLQLPNYRIYLKLMIDGTPSKPFSAGTLPPPTPTFESHAQVVITTRP